MIVSIILRSSLIINVYIFNFHSAGVLIIWDRIFGTFKAEDKPKPMTSVGSNQQFPSFLATAQGDARIVLATSGTRMLAASENGLRFLRNAVAWAAVDARLSGIRARTITDKNLYPTTSSERFSVRLVAIASPVLVLIIIGLFNLQRRRRV